MVKDFTKEDIPVLGRLVSISEDNTVANAEQIWDAKKDQSIQNTVDDINAEIVQIKQQGGLSQEYKNILDWLLDTTNLSEYNTGGWNSEAEFYYSGKYFKGAVSFDHGGVTINKGDLSVGSPEGEGFALSVEGLFPNSDNKAIETIGQNYFYGATNIIDLYEEYDNILNVEGGSSFYGSVNIGGGNLLCDEDIISDGDIIAHGLLNASDGVFININQDPRQSNGYFDRGYGLVNYKKSSFIGDAAFDGNAYFENGFSTQGNVYIAGETEFESNISVNGIANFAEGNVLINDTPLEEYIQNYSFHTVQYDQELTRDEIDSIIQANHVLLSIPGRTRTLRIQESYKSVSNANITIRWVIVTSSQSNQITINEYILSIIPAANFSYTWNSENNEIYIDDLLSEKQDSLISGENIKTINGESILGSGNISVTGGGGNGNVVDNNYVHTDNNYTTEEKSKLAGIAAGAEVNVQADWTESDTESDAYILHKPEYLASFATLVNALTTDGHFVTQNDMITVGGITSQDIQNWNNKADAATTLSGYNIIYDQAVFEEDENNVFTLNAQYKVDHPVRMTSGDNQWTTDGDNKVPTVAAVYNKFLANDDSTVVKTIGNQTISGTKTFSVAPVVPGIKSSGSNTQASNKVFTTNGSISTLKTINNTTLFGTGNIDTTYSDFTAPTNNVAGVAGLVPAPAAGTQDYILSATGWKNMQTIVDAVVAQIQSGETWVLSNISIRDRVYQDYDYAMCVTNTKDNNKYLITSDGDQRGYPICGKLSQYGVTWTQDGPTKKDEYTSNYYPEDMVTDFNLDGILSYDAFSYLITG